MYNREVDQLIERQIDPDALLQGLYQIRTVLQKHKGDTAIATSIEIAEGLLNRAGWSIIEQPGIVVPKR